MFDAPIPLQSLTAEPKNYAWERPPKIVNPDEAITHHIKRLSEPQTLDNIIFTIEFGMPTRHLAESICTAAVAQGIHSIDVSLIITPVIQEYLNATAKQAGVEFKEEFDKSKESEKDLKFKAVTLFKKSLKKNVDKDEGAEYLEDLVEEEEKEEEEIPQEESKGLMARV
tara:strand:- start:4181 stop:4687 length:507 start_codon:yes stop_codon:yes gene_type:complete